jgi:hypothetical protein
MYLLHNLLNMNLLMMRMIAFGEARGLRDLEEPDELDELDEIDQFAFRFFIFLVWEALEGFQVKVCFFLSVFIIWVF